MGEAERRPGLDIRLTNGRRQSLLSFVSVLVVTGAAIGWLAVQGGQRAGSEQQPWPDPEAGPRSTSRPVPVDGPRADGQRDSDAGRSGNFRDASPPESAPPSPTRSTLTTKPSVAEPPPEAPAPSDSPVTEPIVTTPETSEQDNTSIVMICGTNVGCSTFVIVLPPDPPPEPEPPPSVRPTIPGPTLTGTKFTTSTSTDP